MFATESVPSMRFRVAAAVAALALLVILAQSVAMFSLFEEKEEEFIESLITQQIAHSMEVWASAPEAAYPHTPDMQLFRIAKGDALPASLPGPIRQLAVGNHELYLDGREFHVAVRDDPQARFILVYDVDDHENRLRGLRLITLTAAVLLALLVLLVTYVLAGRVVVRLEHLARRVANGSPGSLVEPGMERELLAIAHAVDGYRAQQEAQLERERDFAAHLSHELRTPLTAIRTDAEMLASQPDLPAGVGKRALRMMGSVDRVTALAGSLLLLAREAQPALPEKVLLHEAVQGVWDALQRATPSPLELTLDVPAECVVLADPSLLDLVLRNVFDNALRHSRAVADGCIVCRLDGTRLSIIDCGDGFAPAELAHVFERFYKGAQGGHGLGLALVDHVCRATGWRVAAQNAADGGGEVTIDFGAALEVSGQTGFLSSTH
ncbi:sensor histidine kinase [Dechloromonas sp. TW-R-39-2]|uniref:sensor histidine kinase n=1 Tax=Dechloromonas sp. TW-R-39-2 TaxID=2654218 RepID=UPI00193E7072|nr:HAMP domain-containing sensor histidine kinase [Dechloromonas sp. TW-R-39-2]QRM18665.1 sensor histidine kinase [Dechloromonas sp. TW-R-39-2]